ncbi:DUF3800 domain-containing protein [Rhizobium sp. TRM95796]|uniref:DUF3800 domain-containing protein n=1 Tax=Rhizobium sp. TRM95796 TaxID=2979862 RepID=UPI0021E726BD|nr:DUF3800 domain-containing protein [Rhizobium sp. TRM95796]MCV3767212.1 DUF3800 domain-containing protein [Rhizobium sp. TRM95796]
MENGEYIFYADESGDHSLTAIDRGFPIFVLSICGFRISDYCKKVVPAFQQLKFRYFGHDMVVLHERDIRKQTGDFTFLADMAARERFLLDLTEVIRAAQFKIFSVTIDKDKFSADFFPDNPYVIALRYCLEEIYRHLKSKKISQKSYHFVFERRGLKEDRDLELEFRRIADGENVFREALPGFHIKFADKESNSTGMQLADLTARPIGIHYLHPGQQNRSFDTIMDKIHKHKNIRRFRSGVLSEL